MLRALSMFSLGGVFLMISPKLRGSVQDAIGTVYNGMQLYAPYSYVAFVMLVIIVFVTSVSRGAQAR